MNNNDVYVGFYSLMGLSRAANEILKIYISKSQSRQASLSIQLSVLVFFICVFSLILVEVTPGRVALRDMVPRYKCRCLIVSSDVALCK